MVVESLAWVEFKPTVLLQVGRGVYDDRMHGDLVVEFRDEDQDGIGGILNEIDLVVSALRYAFEDGVHYRTPTVETIGREEHDYIVKVRVPFYADREVNRQPNGAFAVVDREAAHNAVTTRYKTLIADVWSLVTQYPNFPNVSKNGIDRWTRVSVQWNTAILLERGVTKTFDTSAVFVVEIFVRLGKGSQPYMEIVDAVDVAFRLRDVAGLSYKVPYPVRVGRVDDDEGPWWKEIVHVPFDFMETT